MNIVQVSNFGQNLRRGRCRKLRIRRDSGKTCRQAFHHNCVSSYFSSDSEYCFEQCIPCFSLQFSTQQHFLEENYDGKGTMGWEDPPSSGLRQRCCWRKSRDGRTATLMSQSVQYSPTQYFFFQPESSRGVIFFASGLSSAADFVKSVSSS